MTVDKLTYYIFHSDDKEVVHYGEIDTNIHVETGQPNQLFYEDKKEWEYILLQEFNINLEQEEI
jgi:hypothetical protein